MNNYKIGGENQDIVEDILHPMSDESESEDDGIDGGIQLDDDDDTDNDDSNDNDTDTDDENSSSSSSEDDHAQVNALDETNIL